MPRLIALILFFVGGWIVALYLAAIAATLVILWYAFVLTCALLWVLGQAIWVRLQKRFAWLPQKKTSPQPLVTTANLKPASFVIPGEKVVSSSFGPGEVMEAKDDRAVVYFERAGAKKVLVSHLFVRR